LIHPLFCGFWIGESWVLPARTSPPDSKRNSWPIPAGSPSGGKRSFGSGRSAYHGDYPSDPEYKEHTNSQFLVMARLEDTGPLHHL
jgi:hypothetical protein